MNRVRQIGKAIVALSLGAAQNDDVVLACGDQNIEVCLSYAVSWIVDFKAFKFKGKCFTQRVFRVVLSVNKAIPAWKALNVLDAHYTCSIVGVILQICLASALRRHSQCSVL